MVEEDFEDDPPLEAQQQLRTYSWGWNTRTHRDTLTIHCALSAIPFSLWRDLGRLAGMSSGTPHSITYEFLVRGRKALAEKLLHSACLQERKNDALPGDATGV